MKRQIMLYMTNEIIEMAKKRNINISKVAEEALISILQEKKEEIPALEEIQLLQELDLKKAAVRASLDEKISTKKKAEFYFKNNQELWDKATKHLKTEERWTADKFVNDRNRIKVIEKLLEENHD